MKRESHEVWERVTSYCSRLSNHGVLTNEGVRPLQRMTKVRSGKGLPQLSSTRFNSRLRWPAVPCAPLRLGSLAAGHLLSNAVRMVGFDPVTGGAWASGVPVSHDHIHA